MSENRRRYVNEHFENNRGWLALDRQVKSHMVETVMRLIGERPIPMRKFFDLDHNASKLADISNIPAAEARKKILGNPVLLFDLNNIKYDAFKSGQNAHIVDYNKHQIITSAIETLEQTGHRPNVHSGVVLYGPLANGERTWGSVHTALVRMSEGLCDIQEDTLSDFLDACKIPAMARGITKAPLTLPLIESSVRATLRATGRRPVSTDGEVKYGPLAGKETWNGIDIAIYHEMRGLKGCGYKTLPQFMDARGIAVDQPQRGTPRNVALGIDDIEQSIRATFEQTARRPTKNDGEVQFGPLAGVEKWNNIDAAFKRQNRGLKGCGYDSLKAFMKHLEIPENIQEHRHNKPSQKPPITLDDIITSIKDTFLATDKRPIADGTMIKHGPLKDQLTWSSLNNTISDGRRGLKNCGYTNLKEIIQSLNLQNMAGISAPPVIKEGAKPFHMHTVLSYQGPKLVGAFSSAPSAVQTVALAKNEDSVSDVLPPYLNHRLRALP